MGNLSRINHSKTLRTFVFLSTFLSTTILFETIFKVPMNDILLILQRILYFVISVLISGVMVTYLQKKILLAIITINILFVLSMIF